MGDFGGLDDVMTENPRVVAGMIDIFGGWIDRYKIDGFRIDTARHVNPEFWQAFVPAMLARARANGIPHFHIFGEVSLDAVDPATLAEHTRVDKLPAVLDFAFRRAVIDTVAGSKGTDVWETLFAGDPLYEHGEATAAILPTFTGNHDNGRFAHFARAAFPQGERCRDPGARRTRQCDAADAARRADDLFGRRTGVRRAMAATRIRARICSPSKVDSYNAATLVGSTSTTAVANFDEHQPLYRQIAALARLRTSHPALTRGRTMLRFRGETPGLLAVSRFDPVTDAETLLVFNTGTTPVDRPVKRGDPIDRLPFACRPPVRPAAAAPGSVRVTLPPLGYAVCAAESK